jgi:hypothetical protein
MSILKLGCPSRSQENEAQKSETFQKSVLPSNGGVLKSKKVNFIF